MRRNCDHRIAAVVPFRVFVRVMQFLATITAGLALAGVNVHAAELETRDGHAIDRFSLTDRDGAKLGRERKDAIRTVILGGARGRGRLGRFARR